APGGLTEMSLVALSMNAEVAYISIHHLARIALVIAFAPIVMKWLLRRS
ncbi:MAG: AbrB family transcriptional regulator, partial [Marivivens sp.]|nr:AbrB family transcriptional regulator [Marivivens sp.]NBT50144.1 AbrB family transcriptional regulator [Marivivens sp.]